MALNLNFDMGDNEYMAAADKARRDAESGGGSGGGGFIASVLDALGIHRQVAKPPKQTDLGEQKAQENAAPKPQPVTDDKGEVVGTKTPASTLLDQAAVAAGVAPLPMTQPLSGQGIPRPLTAVDPDLAAQGIIKPLKLGK